MNDKGHMKEIMLIEDDDSLRDGLTLLLSQEGFSVTTLPDGSRLMEFLQKRTPDLFLIDYRLPGKDGAQVVKSIRHITRMKHVPIVVISASGQDVTKIILASGANMFVRKPFQTDKLVRLLQELTGR